MPLFDDDFYEGDEELWLELFATGTPDIVIDENRRRAVGVIEDNDPEPFLQIIKPYPAVHEGQDLMMFWVRLGDSSGNETPSAEEVTVKVSTVDDPDPASHDCSTWAPAGEDCEWATAVDDYEAVDDTLTFTPGGSLTQSVDVSTFDDTEGELIEIVLLELSDESGAPVLQGWRVAGGRILDDEARVSILDVAADEGEDLNFKLTLSRAPAADVVIRYELKDLSDPNAGDGATFGADCAPAVDGVDYRGPPSREGTVTISASDQEADIAVESCHDTRVEPDEVFWLAVSVDSGEAVPPDDGGAWGTIRNNDTPVITVSDQTAQERPADAPADGTLTFTVNLEVDGAAAHLAGEVSVSYAVEQDSPVSAEQGVDYAAPSGSALEGTLVFGPGTAAEQTVTVDLLADHEFEHDETFLLRLSDTDTSDYLALAEAVATGTILDDPPPVLSVDGFEGPEGSTAAFTVTLADDRDETVTVAYRISGDEIDANGDTATAPGHATKPADFDPVPDTDPLTGTLTFNPGETSRAVEVSLLHDTIANEPDETLRLTLTNPSQAALFGSDPDNSVGQIHGVGTITNVDPPELSVDDPGTFDPAAPVLEGDTMTFTITLERARAGETVTVDYAVVSQEAKSDEDFPKSPDFEAAPPATLTLDANNPTATVDVVTLTDKIAENAETLHLVLSQATPDHVAIAKAVGVGTITDVSPAIVRVNNPTAEEGDPLGFVISLVDLAGDPAQIRAPVTVEYHTADRSAVAGAVCTAPDADYLAPSATSVTFAPGGATQHRVPVETCTDTRDERDETMALVLGVDPDNDAATLGDTEGTGTIVDSPPPYMRIDDPAAVREGEAVEFTVSLNDENGLVSTSEIVTVKYLTRDGTATAREDDYVPELSGEITFQPGAMQQTLTINTLTDDDWEPAEEFRVDLHTPENAILDKAVGTGTIRADCIERGDSEIPRLTVHGQEVDEGSHGNTWASLDRPLCFGFTMEWMLAAGTATAADFFSSTYFRPTTSTLNAHVSTNERFSVYPFIIEDDDLDEEDEEFRELVRWESGMPARFLRNNPWIEAPSTILDNDPLPNVSIADAAAMAGDSMTFEVSLDAVSGREVTVDYYTVDVTAEGNGVDYSSVPAGVPRTVTIPAGQRSETFTVQTVANTPGEIDETFHVVLADASNARIDDGVGVGTILAYAGPSLIIADASADEDQTMNFSVTLSEAAPHLVTVDYAANVHSAGLNPATPGDDYVAVSDTLTFSIGQTQQNIPVDIEPDDIDEPDETFLVELSNQTAGVSLADAVAVGTINGNVECIDLTSPSAVNLPPIIGQVTGPSVSGYTDIAVREDSGEITLTLTFETPFCHGYPVLYERWGGSAQRNVDYVMPGFGQAQMAPLDPDVDIVIPIVNDNFTEGDEDVELRLRGDTSGRFRKFMEPLIVLFDIVDDDVSHLELPDAGDTFTSEGGFLSFVVRLDKPTTERVEFYYETRGGPAPVATEDVDYEPTRGRAAIAAGELSVTIPVRTIEDSLFEHDENVELRLSNLTGAEPDPDGDVAVGRIVNDDDPPAVSVSNPFGDEGAALVFEVTLDTPAGREASLSYSTSNGSATAGDDYADTSGSLTFDAGETAKTVSVQALTDGEFEGSEYFFLDLSSNVLRFDDNRGTGTIRDVTPRRVSVSDAVVDEGGVLNFVVGFDEPPTSSDITVAYRTVAVTALAGHDYGDDFESAPGELRILAGRTFAVVGVQTEQDSLDEDHEQLKLVLSDPVGAVLVAGEAVGTIRDDDPEPLLSVDDPEATENGDGTPVVFTLRLSEVSGRDVSVRYSTVDIDSAKPGEDYVAESGEPVTIPAGAQTAQVFVGLVNDDVEEEVERFLLELWDPSNAGFGDNIGAATILDDDGLIEILLDTPDPVYEGPGAAVDFVVRLSRADPVDPVTFGNYMVGGSANPFDDYTPIAISWTIDPGDTSLTISVQLVDDDVVEDTESFVLGIGYASSNATISGNYATATATILDDDALPKLSVSDAPVATEGATAMFSVELSRSSTRPVTVEYAAVVDPFGGDAAAIPGQDFEAVTGTLTIPARSTSATVTVPLPDDALDEHTETFWLRLADPTGATVDDGTAVGSIRDDDPLPQLNIADSGAFEGDPIRFEVTLEPASGRAVTVPWATADSATGDPASPTDDYVAASGTLTFPAGTTTVHIDIDTVEDDVSEPDETFQIQLGQPTNATVDDGIAVGAIRDDDGLPRISIAGVEVTEDKSPAVFVVTLSRTSSQTVTMEYFTTQDTATAGDDYGTPDGEATGTLLIPPGLDTGEISVYIADDDEGEDTETFWITLHNPQNAVIAEGAGTAVGTILDDDGKPRLTVEDAEECEDGSNAEDCDVRTCRYGFQNGGLTYESYIECQTIVDDPGACQPGACTGNGTIDFAIQLSHASTVETSVRYTTFARSAADARDYVASSGTLTIPMGHTSASIPVVLVDDAIPEALETFLLRLDNPDGVELEAAEAFGTIIDDDAPPKVSAAPFDGYANENDAFNYHRVTLSHPSDLTVSVDYEFDYVGNRSPYQGVDETPGTLTFAPGVVEQTIAVPLYDNAVATYDPSLTHAYANTYYRLYLSNRINASYGIGTAAGIVWDDETPPYVDSVAVQDTIEGSGAATFTITLNRFSDQAVTATYQTVDGTATAGSDYSAVTATVTFPPGTITADVTVSIFDDSVHESDESFTLSIISDARNSNLTVLPRPFTNGRGSGSGTVRIIDDDVLPEISVGDVAANENAGTLTFWVSLSRPSAQEVTVNYATADGTAAAGSDYTAAVGTLTIPAFDTGAPVTVTIHDDATTESDETFELALSGAVGATIAAGRATATIIEDDNLQTISISDKSIVREHQPVQPLYLIQGQPRRAGHAVDVGGLGGPRSALAGRRGRDHRFGLPRTEPIGHGEHPHRPDRVVVSNSTSSRTSSPRGTRGSWWC